MQLYQCTLFPVLAAIVCDAYEALMIELQQLYICFLGISIIIHIIIEGTNNLDGVDRDMVTTVIAVNTGEDVHDYYPH